MAQLPKLSPPESLGAAIAPLAALSQQEFEKLREATSTRRLFNVKPKVAKELASEIPALGPTVTFTLGALNFLYGRLALLREKSSLETIVAQIIDDFEVPCSPELRVTLEQRLIKLLRKNENYDAAQKLQRLEKGFLPNAIGFRTFVDLRPDFGGDENLQFGGFLKVIQFRIRTDADAEKTKEFVFQINEDGLDDLQQAIDRARAKIRALDELPSLAQHLLPRATT
ncbi:hypothetical protein [Bradyrhizobium sp. HKCCYLRH1030]|uniref:hypothetical protein n=1 Tax=Bradyrhizobium sp. HKCCYLRH1030 TaxID=3420744 RepID=UPI003EC0F135